MDQNSMMGGGFPPMQGQGNTNTNMGNNNGGTMIMPNPSMNTNAAPQGMTGMGPNGMPMPVGAVPGMVAPQPMPAVSAGETVQEQRKSSVGEIIILVVVCLIAAGAIAAAVYFFVQWNNLKTSYDTDKGDAVATAIKEQQEKDEANFEQREKTNTVQFTGPSDFGSISFYYQKTWNVYIKSDGSNNSDYEAYFSKSAVDPIDDEASRYALRFSIRQAQSSDVMTEYNSLVTEGKLSASQFSSDNNQLSGTRYEGKITDSISGEVLVFKVNDKTAILQTDSMNYRDDFETLIKTLRKNS